MIRSNWAIIQEQSFFRVNNIDIDLSQAPQLGQASWPRVNHNVEPFPYSTFRRPITARSSDFRLPSQVTSGTGKSCLPRSGGK